MPLTIATWNVNSIRVREEAVRTWLRANPVDLLALQELKMATDLFPGAGYTEDGYTCYVNGQKTWNGVAWLARRELTEVLTRLPGMEDDPQARFLAARCGDIRVANLYVPNGAEIGTDKFAYKLRWLEALAGWLEKECDPAEPLLLTGDFNLAPAARDMHDPDKYAETILFTPPEREALQRLLDWGLVDLFRNFHDAEGLYSWWGYRGAAFRRGLGVRIDLHLVTAPLVARALSCEIDVEPRRWEKPSDHTPVVATFAS